MITDKARSLSSEEHIKHSETTGKKGEELFINTLKENKIPFTTSSKNQNIKEHIDIFMYSEPVDVKGLKKSHREGYLVIEFKNVLGKAGSCSKDSKAKLIAFQLSKEFLVLRKDEILEFCRANVSKEYVDSFNDCYLKLYSRKGRNDLMTKISLLDTKNFKFRLLLKY